MEGDLGAAIRGGRLKPGKKKNSARRVPVNVRSG